MSKSDHIRRFVIDCDWFSFQKTFIYNYDISVSK